MLHLSVKGEYGILAMLALCLHPDSNPLQVKAIAKTEKLSVRFLEQVMTLLKNRGLVEGVRGPYGGYRLVKPPEEIRLGEVLQALEGPVVNTLFPDNNVAGVDEKIVLREVWEEVNTWVNQHLDSINFKDLCERKKKLERNHALMFHI